MLQGLHLNLSEPPQQSVFKTATEVPSTCSATGQYCTPHIYTNIDSLRFFWYHTYFMLHHSRQHIASTW